MSSNGSNPRLDRIEKLIEQGARANKEAHARFEREMAEHRAEVKREVAEHKSLMRADMLKTRRDMRRWAALGVMESRRHRRKIAALEAESATYRAKSEKFRAYTEEKLAEIGDKLDGLIGYVDGMKRPGPANEKEGR